MIDYSFGDTLVKVDNVSLVLDGKQILRDINLEIKDIIVPGRVTGQIFGLIGPSGRGKTCLLKIISGLIKPTTGQVMIGDLEKGLAKQVQAGNVGVVFQSYPLFEHRSIWKNLEIVFHKNETPAQKKEKIEYYLNRFNLLEHKDKYPAQLSGGQRQRVSCIQQIISSEKIILMDEPFSGLDPISTHEICSLIQEVADMDEENTIIVVSHDIHSTCAISDVIWLLGNEYEKNSDGSYKLDTAGQKTLSKPGATIKFQQNLMDMGLTWNPEVIEKPSPEFMKLSGDIRHAFGDL